MLRFGEGNIHAAVAAALGQLGGISVPPDAFQDDRLPLELRMNVRVTDAEGRQLASGRDLEAIRRELGQQAAESFSQVDDPRWNRDGLTDWDFDELPAEIELPRGRLSVKGYPALLDRGGSVSLRLVDSPGRAEHETRFGLRRLCLLATRRELKAQVDWLPNLDRWSFTRRRCRLRPSRTACRAAGRPGHGGRSASCPRTKDEFQQLLSAGRERIGWAVQELIASCWPLFEGYHQASRRRASLASACCRYANLPWPWQPAPDPAGSNALRKANIQPSGTRRVPATRWQYAIDDIRDQIARLMEPHSFAKTPWEWLRQYPRYFRAIRCRLENLPGGVPRDSEKFQEFQPRWQLYLEQARHQQSLGIVDPELLHLRWMLEEYRVSLFAQKLGTAIPVSPKRLEQQWAKLQA